MAHTTTDDEFHEIQLNGKQLVFLFMAATVMLVVVFLMGVLVGRGVRAERGGGEPLSAESAPVAEPPIIASSPTGGPPAAGNEQLSYPNRLSGAERGTEELKSPAAAPPEPTSPPPAEPKAPPSTAAPAPAVAAETAGVRGEPAGDGFAIQVTALSQQSEADSIATSLSGKGYPAYVLAPEPGAPAVYRVRVGKFKDRREAESIAARLQKEGQFKPWIVR